MASDTSFNPGLGMQLRVMITSFLVFGVIAGIIALIMMWTGIAHLAGIHRHFHLVLYLGALGHYAFYRKHFAYLLAANVLYEQVGAWEVEEAHVRLEWHVGMRVLEDHFLRLHERKLRSAYERVGLADEDVRKLAVVFFKVLEIHHKAFLRRVVRKKLVYPLAQRVCVEGLEPFHVG